jgi:hypothetical protein
MPADIGHRCTGRTDRSQHRRLDPHVAHVAGTLTLQDQRATVGNEANVSRDAPTAEPGEIGDLRRAEHGGKWQFASSSIADSLADGLHCARTGEGTRCRCVTAQQ